MMEEKPQLKFRDLVEFLVLPILTAGVFVLWDLNKNMNMLNVQVGVLINNNDILKERIQNLESRVYGLENQKQRGNQ